MRSLAKPHQLERENRLNLREILVMFVCVCHRTLTPYLWAMCVLFCPPPPPPLLCYSNYANFEYLIKIISEWTLFAVTTSFRGGGGWRDERRKGVWEGVTAVIRCSVSQFSSAPLITSRDVRSLLILLGYHCSCSWMPPNGMSRAEQSTETVVV